MQFLPHDEETSRNRAIDGEPISDKAIETMLANLGGVPLGIDPEHDFRISVAGAQERRRYFNIRNSG